jgi:hypothetical protein
MEYFVFVTEPQMVVVNAESEEEAIEMVRKQVLAQNPRSIATYSVAQEAVIIEEEKEEEIKQEDPA